MLRDFEVDLLRFLCGLSVLAVSKPRRRDWPHLIKVGCEQVDDFVKCRGEGDLGRGDRRIAGISSLKYTGVQNDFVFASGCLRAKSHDEIFLPGYCSRESGDRRCNSLIARDNGLDDPLFRGQNLV